MGRQTLSVDMQTRISENRREREIADWTYLNAVGAVFARLFQGSSKPPVKRRWDRRYPYTSYHYLV